MQKMTMPKILCFNVESNGLHGEAFAVGAVVLDENGNEYAAYRDVAPIVGAIDPGVKANVLPVFHSPLTCLDTRELRENFRAWYRKYREDALVVVDCGWPVEARFLAACVDDDPDFAAVAPYPLHDVTTLLLAYGWDPIGTYEDNDVHGQPHDPLYDARKSARLARRMLVQLELL